MGLVNAGAAPPRTRQQFVYYALRDAIMQCELQPGQRITTEDVARRLSVSPIPVREAFKQLQTEGLLDTIPHTGTIVAPISRASITEVFTVMEGLELAATHVAAERVAATDVDALTTLLRKMDSALQDGEHDSWSDLNARFHQAIAHLTTMPMLEEMTARALSHWDRVRRYFFADVLIHRMDQSQREHYALVRAMQGHDGIEIERLVKAHNRGALAAYMEHLAAASPDESGDEQDTKTAS